MNVGGVACWLLYEEGSWTELTLCLGYCISNKGVTEFQFLGMLVVQYIYKNDLFTVS